MPLDIGEVLAIARRVGEGYTREWPRLGISWYDHRYDWARGLGNWMWCERGILGHHYIREGDRVLDLCCGDGLFCGLFFSKKAALVHGVDRDPQAIALAQQLYSRDNVEFFEIDILEDDFTGCEYNTILFYQALEHFTHEQTDYLLGKIAATLAPGGILLGSTALMGIESNPEHAVEFASIEEVENLLAAYFEYVEMWTTVWEESRVEVYFLCSQDHGSNDTRQ